MIEEIHDGLRLQGLVPAAEDCPFLVCSNEYRLKLREALRDIEEPADLQVEIENAESEIADLKEGIKEAQDDLSAERGAHATTAYNLKVAEAKIDQLEKQLASRAEPATVSA